MHKNDEQADRAENAGVNADQEAFAKPIAAAAANCGYDHCEQDCQANEGEDETDGCHELPLIKCLRTLPLKAESQ
jgi:hypothetical protein